MKLGRNDPCYCGSGKKYKNCCLKDDHSKGIKKERRSRAWNEAVRMLRKNPHRNNWEYINEAIDEILKKKLKNASILKYNPIDWITPLFFSYFILKEPYWSILYGDTIKRNSESIQHFFSHYISYDTPLYIRIISLLLKIIFDRIGLSKYEKLPRISFDLYQTPFYSFSRIPGEGIFKYVDDITNSATLDIKELFIQARNEKLNTSVNLNQFILFPIPFYEIKNYLDFLKILEEKYSKKLSFEDLEKNFQIKDQYGKDVIITQVVPSEVLFLRTALFKKNLLPDIIQFIKKIYCKLAPRRQIKEVENLCNLYLTFFKKFPLNAVDPIAVEYYKFDVLMLYENFSENFFEKFIYSPENQRFLLDDPLKSDVPLFRNSLDLFNRPFIHDRLGFLHFSLLWLFDSLISKLTRYLREDSIGRKRGFLSENYLSNMIKINLPVLFPNHNMTAPFKLILTSQDLLDYPDKYSKSFKIYEDLKLIINKYEINNYEIICPAFVLDNHMFIEFDIAFIFRDTLFVIEHKDNLFWDIRDTTDILFMRRRSYERKIKIETNYLMKSLIKEKLKEKGLGFHKIKPLVIDHCHISHRDFLNYRGLFNYLKEFNYELNTGKSGEFLPFFAEIRYPDNNY